MNDPRGEVPDMADYGVGGEGWHALPWSWAAQRLTESRNYWLVTASAAGRPHAMPVWGVWDDDRHRFAFSCSPSARKAANLAENPRCVVAPEDTVECVSVEGRAQLLTDPADIQPWVGRYLAKYQPISPELNGEFVSAHALFEVTPDRALAIIEREEEFAQRATRWRFHGEPPVSSPQ